MRLVAALLLFGISAISATLPPGFVETLVADGIVRPTAMAFSPDGRLFVLEQDGRCRIIKNGALLSAPFVSISVDGLAERGLLGIAFDPDFAANGWIYLYHTTNTTPPRNRIVRFTANGDVAQSGSERVIREFEPLSAGNHNGGALHFGPDGKLYVAIGENYRPELAQSLNTTFGKILRLNKDGSIPPDNPFCGAQEARCAIWVFGLRNPFTFDIQPGTGRMYINDVGNEAFEEINEAAAGDVSTSVLRNYGWPTTEGAFNPAQYPQFRSPVHAYAHTLGPTGECAITGGAFYNPATPLFPATYVGRYFFADNCASWIRTIDPATRTVTDFATNAGHPVDIKTGPDGALYYLSRAYAQGEPGTVYRIAPATGRPQISTQPASITVRVGVVASFSVAAAGQPPLTYQWQRNGINISGATSATYSLAAAQLTDSGAQFRAVVTNALGSAVSEVATLTVTTTQPPTAAITQPVTGRLYSGGDTITFTGTATDPEDGVLPASAFAWEVLLHHNEHTHPFIPRRAGITTGTFVIPTDGHTETSVFYRIYLTVTDSSGATRTVTSDIVPRKSELQLATNPPGLTVTLDGTPLVAPASVTSVVGVMRSLGALTPQTLNGITYQFTSWSDGQPASHAISTPLSPTTYTANFTVSNTCSAVTVSPGSVAVPAQGQAGTLSLTAASGCAWTSLSDSPWIQVYPLVGAGTQPLLYTVFPNFTAATRTGTITVGSTTVRITQSPATATLEERFVQRLYFNFFGRLPSVAELAFQVAALRNSSRAQLFAGFFGSAEFNNGGRYVAGLYVGLLDRNAEYGGWLFQRNAISTGLVQTLDLVGNFLESAEYMLRFGRPDDFEFVRLLYRHVLLREASESETAFQGGVLKAGTSRRQLASNFLNGAEFRAGTGPRLTAFLLYALTVQRQPASAEFAALQTQVAAGVPIATLAESILTSPEFLNSF